MSLSIVVLGGRTDGCKVGEVKQTIAQLAVGWMLSNYYPAAINRLKHSKEWMNYIAIIHDRNRLNVGGSHENIYPVM